MRELASARRILGLRGVGRYAVSFRDCDDSDASEEAINLSS
jgi:hypothetical protein